MRKWCLGILHLSVACLTLWSPAVTAQESYPVEVRTQVAVPMRDGVQLSTNIFLPKAEGKWPVILMRSPYGKGDEKQGDGLYYAARGYVFVSQDCRGRGASQGQWEPFLNEATDGSDTQKWILAQPWCNGMMGTMGGSYVGFTQWASAPNAGAYLKAMVPVVPLVDPYGDVAYIGGAFDLSLMMGWGSPMAAPPTGMKMPSWNGAGWLKAYRTLPLADWDRVLGYRVQYLRDWVAHPHYDSYWAARGVRDRRRDIQTPILAIGGWYDIFAKTTLDHVNAVRATSRSSEARRHQHVLMGPWTHGISGTGKVGDLDFGKGSAINLRERQTQWFDHWLKGRANGVDQWPPYHIFVMGRNVWRDEQAWPPQGTCYTKYYLHSQGSAQTRDGNGTLSTAEPLGEPMDEFVYDPNDPVPTLGGCNLVGCPAGPKDQTAAETRHDVLVFTSAELDSDLEVTGPVKAVLYAATSARDTDWTAKLVDVYPDGRPISLCDGILRARYRDSLREPKLLDPGKIYRYEIDLWVTSSVFLRGHRIRVEISSSNFPRFDRNLNTGEPCGTGTTWEKATQTVYHDGDHPSHVFLPVAAYARQPNTLSRKEKDAGWRLLFDGSTTEGWRGYRSSTMPASWRAENGSLLSRREKGQSTGDIITLDQYADFELSLEWKMTKGGNSGVIYRATEEGDQVWDSGAEYQILDYTGHLDGLNPLASAGACCAVFAPAKDGTRPLGQWNQTRIVARGKHVEHWLNGERLLEYEVDSESWQAHVKTSKFFQTAYGQGNWGRALKGHIALQDYGGAIEFRNIKIRPVADEEKTTQP
jgi:putative CocE/NonD family hydrolase